MSRHSLRGIHLAALIGVSAYTLATAAGRRSQETPPQAAIDELNARIESLSQCLAHLNVFGETLADTPDVDTLLEHMVPMVERTFDADWSTLHLLTDDGAIRVMGVPAGVPEAAAVALHHVIATAQPACIPHPQGEPSPLYDEDADSDCLGGFIAVPLVVNGAVTGVLAVGSHDQREFSQRDTGVLSTIAAQIAVAVQNAAMYRKLEDSYLATVGALASAMEANDEYTADHSATIARMAVVTGKQLGFDASELRRLHYAALLHDVGKIGIPDDLLHKGGVLSATERELMAEHTIIGEHIVSQAEYLRPVAPLVRAAHERWDGHGYPDGLAGEAIPLASRIVFVCDAFHAMTSDRPYRRARSVAEALDELRAQAGRQFDPRVVEAFARVVPTLAGRLQPVHAT
jgi:HD-GYP domain-containing protein (c-di-GMP phosphodiesterase class II)